MDACLFTRKRLAAEPPVHAVLFAETRWKVALRRARPDALEHRLNEKPVVRRGDAGVGRFAGKKRFDPLLHFISQHGSVSVHLSL